MDARHFITLAVLQLTFLLKSQLTTAGTTAFYPTETTSTTKTTYTWDTTPTYTTTDTTIASTTASTTELTIVTTTTDTTTTYSTTTDTTWAVATTDTSTEVTFAFTTAEFTTTDTSITDTTTTDTTTEITIATTTAEFTTTDTSITDTTTTDTTTEIPIATTTAEFITYATITDSTTTDTTTTDTTTEVTTSITPEFNSDTTTYITTTVGISPDTTTIVTTSTSTTHATLPSASSSNSDVVIEAVLGTIVAILVIGIISFIIWKHRERLFKRPSNQDTRAGPYDNLALSSDRLVNVVNPEVNITVERTAYENEYLNPDSYYRNSSGNDLNGSGGGRPLKAAPSHVYQNQTGGHLPVPEKVSAQISKDVVPEVSVEPMESKKGDQERIYDELDTVCQEMQVYEQMDIVKTGDPKTKSRPPLPPKLEKIYSNFPMVSSGDLNRVDGSGALVDTETYVDVRIQISADDKVDNV